MKTVYAVSMGEYSDYGVVAIFTTKEKAEQYMKAFPRDRYDGYNDIEEYELDEAVDIISKGYQSYQVQMDRDGNHTEVKLLSSPLGSHRKDYIDRRVWAGGKVVCRDVPLYQTTMWAKDEITAIKIANDRRRQLIAEGVFDRNDQIVPTPLLDMELKEN